MHLLHSQHFNLPYIYSENKFLIVIIVFSSLEENYRFRCWRVLALILMIQLCHQVTTH